MIDLPAPPPGGSPASSDPPSPPDPDQIRKRQAILVALLGPVVTWVVGVLVFAAIAAPTLPDGQCEGIGWGCSLTPRDTVFILGVLGGVVCIPVATITGALLLFVPLRYRVQAVAANVAVVAGVVLFCGVGILAD